MNDKEYLIIKCPKCGKKYKILKEKVKEGVKVRCKNCGNIFEVIKAVIGEIPARKVVLKEEKVVKKEVEEKVLSEEDKYLHERAKRLARALARDIINYYGPKVEQGLREGNLLEILKDVIEKSRKYYEEKIPEHIRKNTRYFEDAFNEIVAKGRKIL